MIDWFGKRARAQLAKARTQYETDSATITRLTGERDVANGRAIVAEAKAAVALDLGDAAIMKLRTIRAMATPHMANIGWRMLIAAGGTDTRRSHIRAVAETLRAETASLRVGGL